jgi:hypothetical protein
MTATAYIWLAEIGLTRPNGAAETLYICDGGLPPFSGDDADRAYQIYRQRLAGPPSWSVGVSADLTRLAGDVAGGELVILNGDGAYSYVSGCAVGGVIVKRGYEGLPWAAWTAVVSGKGGVAKASLSGRQAGRVSIPIGDLRDAMADPVDSAVYGGGNVGAVGYDGTSDDIKGAGLPLCLGRPRNVAPVAVNAVSRAFQYDAGPAGGGNALFDRGDAANMTLLATGSSAAFDAASPGATQWIDDPSRGLLRLGGALGGDLTLDPIGRSAAGLTAGTAARWLATRRGVGSIGADLAAWAGPAIGAYWPQSPSYAEAVELMARSDGGWIVPDGLGRWRFGRLGDVPAPAAMIGEYRVMDIGVDDPDLAAPVWKVTVRGARNHAVASSSDAIGAASKSTAREAWLREEWRSAVAVNPAIKTIWGDAAREATIETALVNISDMEALAARLLAALGPRPDGTPKRSLAVTVEMTDALLALSPGQTVHLTYPREGIDDDMLLLGVSISDRNKIKLRLWG